MFDEVYPDITPEIQDAAGELLNIIFGLAKRELSDNKGFKIKKAIPTILVGSQLEIYSSKQASTVLSVPCKIDVGTFTLEIQLASA